MSAEGPSPSDNGQEEGELPPSSSRQTSAREEPSPSQGSGAGQPSATASRRPIPENEGPSSSFQREAKSFNNLLRRGTPHQPIQQRAHIVEGGAHSLRGSGALKRPMQYPNEIGMIRCPGRRLEGETELKMSRVDSPAPTRGCADLFGGVQGVNHAVGHKHYDPLGEEDPSWYWPRHLDQYAADKYQEYIPENLIAKLMKDCPLASNPFLQLPDIDTNVQKAMDKRMAPGTTAKLRAYDKDINAIQGKSLRVAGPLGQLFCLLDATIRGRESHNVDLDEVIQLVEKAIILNGQANNACLYERRMNILKQVGGDTKQAHHARNKHKALLKEADGELFGSAFQSKVFEEEKKDDGFVSLFPQQPFSQEPGSKAAGSGSYVHRGGNNNATRGGKGGGKGRGKGAQQNQQNRSEPKSYYQTYDEYANTCDSPGDCQTELASNGHQGHAPSGQNPPVCTQLGAPVVRQGDPGPDSGPQDRVGGKTFTFHSVQWTQIQSGRQRANTDRDIKTVKRNV